MNDDDELGEDTGADTDVRKQGDRETRTSEGTSRETPPPFQPGDIFGEFQLERLLGQGSSGCVFRAFDTVSRRGCALKILIASKQHDLRRNKIGFRRMMGIVHPNLTRVDQMHQADGYLALSMEEIHGDTLAKMGSRYRKLQPHIAHNKLLILTRDYAAGLAAIHSRGLLHRDIKPSNLMVDRQDRGRIIDYGLVGTFDAESDPNCYRDYIAGTPRYISPEAYFQQRYTPAGDMFSLGLVVLEFLNKISGRKAWERSKDTLDEDAVLITSAVDKLSGSVPNVLREACLEMLQINPGDRPTAMQISRLGLPSGRNTVYFGGQPIFGRDSEFQEACDWLSEIYEGKQGRMHIHGPSGIGKTSLVDAIEQHLRSLKWGQVFRARCRPRENKPLQTFDQIVDQIANRYAKSDREIIELDPVSAEILHQAFPGLKDVVQANVRMKISEANHGRIDALQAAVNLSEELRKVGPLILIIDDTQWADGDTHATLDALQTAGGGMLGIVTASRFADNEHRPPYQSQQAQKTIQLQPLRDEISANILAESAKRWSVNLPNHVLNELVKAAAGNPLRLSELANEFRVGGQLHVISTDPNSSSVSNLGNLDRLWLLRAQRLSEKARMLLAYIATAGCSVSIDQLVRLSGMQHDVEIAVSELVHQRLVIDDATGEYCIHMIHDRVSSGVLSTLTREETDQANIAWADLLRTEGLQRSAGRIARHLLDAEKSDKAKPYCQQAAKECELVYAFREAAEWYLTLAELTDDESNRLRDVTNAAESYLKADELVQAAQLYQRLVDVTKDSNEAMKYRILCVQLFVRAGRYHMVRDQLNQIARELGLPGLDLSLWMVAKRSLSPSWIELFYPGDPSETGGVCNEEKQRKLAFCKELYRPMALFDGHYAANLFARAAKLARQIGSVKDQIGLSIASAVHACADRTRRNEGEDLLREIQATAVDQGPLTTGDYWSGKSLAHLLSMNWEQVADAVGAATLAYEECEKPCFFERANIRWVKLYADWYQGNWKSLIRDSRSMVDDAFMRDDRIALFLTTSGLPSAAWLASGRGSELKRYKHLNDECFQDSGSIAELMRFVTECQISLFDGDFQATINRFIAFRRRLRKSQLNRMQLARVLTHQFGGLAALHLNEVSRASKYESLATTCIDMLKREQLGCSGMLSQFYEGILNRQRKEASASRKCLVAAQQLAKEMQLPAFEFAAEDAFLSIDNEEPLFLLRHRMRNSGIEAPNALERIYTVVSIDWTR